MNKRVVLIRPFFQGTFLPYFQLFLNSCRDNPKFDWMIFTDNEDEYDYPKNVHKIKMTFDEAKNLFQSKFDFPISIEGPYKLCDYKASFGYVFSDYIEEYDFWGHNDYDVIYGNLEHFITDEMLDSYDKLFVMGHFTLYRNTPEISTVFMRNIQGRDLYKEVMTSEKNCTFDEDWGDILNVNDIFRKNEIKIYENPNNESNIADIYDKSTHFRVAYWDRHKHKTVVEQKMDFVFAHVDGQLVRYIMDNGQIREREYMYIHLIHRRMSLGKGVLKSKNYVIIPDTFEPLEGKVTINNFDSIKKRQIVNGSKNYLRLRFENLRIKANRLFDRQL